MVLALLTAEAGDLLIIENPEAHLHPKGQSKLAELMCLAAQAGVQIFCETHSDHIVNGVRVGIVNKQQPIDLDKVNILYFHKNEIQSHSQIEFIKLDQYAKIEHNENTKGFFDQLQNDLKKIRIA